MMKPLSLSIAALLLPMCLSAAPVSGIPTMEAVRDRRILDFAEDDGGYIWLGTDKGLFRYNGSVYLPYYADGPDALTSDFVLSLCPDTDHRIWVGTDSGICLVRNGRIERRSPPGTDYVFGLYNFSDSTLLFSSQDALYLYDKADGRREIVMEGRDYEMPFFIHKAGETVWISPGYPPREFRLYRADFSWLRSISLPADERITGIATLRDTVFVSSSGGIRCYSPEGMSLNLPHALKGFEKRPFVFCQDAPHFGGVLFGIRRAGTYLLTSGQESMTALWPEEDFQSSDYYKILPARNAVWLYDWERQLKVLYRTEGLNPRPIPDVGWGEVMIAILPGATEQEAVLVTTSGLYGMEFPSEVIRRLQIVDYPPGYRIRSAIRTRNGDIVLVDNQSVLLRIRQDRGRWVLVSQLETALPGTDIWEDYDGRICTVRGNELHWVKEGGKAGKTILDMNVGGTPCSDGDGQVWLAGPEGLFSLGFKHRFTRIPLEIPDPSCCLPDTTGEYMFVGTANNGLYRYRMSDGQLRHYGLDDGLPDLSVRSLSLDSAGRLWISTRNYIACLSSDEGRFSIFDYSGPFPRAYSRHCSYKLQMPGFGERILFGSDQAISIVDPARSGPMFYVPLTLDAIQVNNRLVNLPAEGDVLTLRHDENQLMIHYSGMDFQRSAQLNYSCFLEGFDKDWVFVGRNLNAVYSHLPPGRYTFRVRVYMPGGNLSPDELSFPFRIQPSFWASWKMVWVYILSGCLLLGTLVVQGITLQRHREAALLAEADRALAESEQLLNETTRPAPRAPERVLTGKDREFVDTIRRYVERGMSDERFNATVLAGQLGMSYTRFYLRAKDLLGVTPQEYLTERRLSHARELLRSGAFNVSEVCYQVGFSSLSGFSRSFKKRFGVPPSHLLKRRV